MKSQGNAMNDDAGQVRPDFVVSDRDGTTAGDGFTEHVADTLRRLGYDVRVNDPYKGAELIRAYADPAIGRHSIQIEINRRLYMDEDAVVKHEGFARLAHDLDRMLGEVAAYVRSRL